MSERTPTIPQRCHACGSMVTLEANRIREDTTLSFRCPGCGSLGTSSYGSFPLDEAQQLAAQQNNLVSNAEAVAEAGCWQSRVADWVASDADAFLPLVRARFPEWRSHLTYKPDPYLDGSFHLTVPSANPKVESPLTLTIAVNEVLIAWFEMWHLHIFRYQDAGQDDKTHLSRAMKEVEDLIEERIVPAEHYKDGSCSGGGNILPGQGIPDDWKQTLLRHSDGKTVSIVARSWRGTYDEEWHSR